MRCGTHFTCKCSLCFLCTGHASLLGNFLITHNFASAQECDITFEQYRMVGATETKWRFLNSPWAKYNLSLDESIRNFFLIACIILRKFCFSQYASVCKQVGFCWAGHRFYRNLERFRVTLITLLGLAMPIQCNATKLLWRKFGAGCRLYFGWKSPVLHDP